MNAVRKQILIAIDWYLPGYRGGGPITSVANLVDALGGEYDFSIITSDRDYAQKDAYPGIEADTWVTLSPHCRVWYCSAEAGSYRHFRRLIADTEYDLLYLQSMFSLRFTIYPLWNSRSNKPEVPVLLAPRGMLHAGALSLKPLKKKLFLALLRITGIHKQLRFQATDEQEIIDIRQVFGADTAVLRAPNLPSMKQTAWVSIPKEPGVLRLVFLSRLTEKKGLHFILEWLREQRANVQLDIVGPDEEQGYWQRCEQLIAALPPHIQVRKHPPAPPEEAVAYLQAAHCFVMPTLGENFGHAIFEALGVGRPVLISDQTPWRDLQARQLGYDIPLKNQREYHDALQQLAAMDQVEWDRWAQAAWTYAAAFIADGKLLAENEQLLQAAMLPEANKPQV